MQRGELDFTITLAAELAEDRKHLPLETALRFLPLVAGERPGEYDRWALR
ncbi:MAG: hypothetical protein JWL67_2435 [Solirubrobacterales bacterium]|nr:hypothetical protein [Solirubrobacterales bacterium]